MTKPLSVAFHIGAHKTASTYLQSALYGARKMLAEAGIRVLTPQQLRRDGASLADRLGLFGRAGGGEDGAAVLRGMARGARKLVLSEENFPGILQTEGRVQLPVYPHARQRLSALTEAIAPQEIDLFLAVRRPTGFLSSAYSQVLFAGTVIAPQSFTALNDWRAVDWHDYLHRLARVPGVGTIHVWRYEDHARVQRLVLRRMLRWKIGGQVPLPEERAHRGLSQKALLRTLEWVEEGRQGKLAAEARRRYPVTDANPVFRLFDPAAEAEAEVAYSAQLAAIEAMDRVEFLHPPKRAATG